MKLELHLKLLKEGSVDLLTNYSITVFKVWSSVLFSDFLLEAEIFKYSSNTFLGLISTDLRKANIKREVR